MKSLCPLLLAVALAACAKEDASTTTEDPGSAAGAGNTMACTADGSAFKGKGDQVGVASFGITKDVLSIGLTLTLDQGGQTHMLSSSLMAIPLHSGTYHFPPLDKPGYSLAEYRIRTLEQEPVLTYVGANYGMYYSAVENDPEAKLKLEVDKLDVSAGSLPGFKRVELNGRFAFNAAALPGAQHSEACTTDGLQRAIKALPSGKPPLPMYDAKVCGAKKVHVECSYHVVQELVVMNAKGTSKEGDKGTSK